MQAVITAVGADNRGLADPIVHTVTDLGANIAEIQMYDHDEERVFSMLTRVEVPESRYQELCEAMELVAQQTGLAIRTWSPDIRDRKPRIAICVTYRKETPLAVLNGIREGLIPAEASVIISNRKACRTIAEEYNVPWREVGSADGSPDDQELIALCDEFKVDYVVLARYMRVLPAASCWQYAGGRIINLHHGLLPGFPGMRPYHDAYASRMLTFGATCHFIVPELDAGNQIINQRTFSVSPGTPLEEVIERGQTENEPACLVEGVRRAVSGEVQLHFNKVVAIRSRV
ncbi:formyltetrahydrofolate deformylase [Botrimarina hoheduenensis]|uniref:Formyltetrahydrofolate deformylase n=1 Tax=Botrimarina hoheduenensis TaxID=2528000 RepID=A0A5C5WDI0_9BACT|nr:formyltransferase family protein [Botrimarina hoheduenensis]TWT48690.1 Formyltetrahydrofolate deformylase [Botrimarina hoheduenensis]